MKIQHFNAVKFFKAVITVLFFLSLLIVFIIGCGTKETGDSFRFVFMTDIHVQPELKADKGYRAAIAKVNELKPDFVITGGDLIMDALGQSFERSKMLYDMYNSISKDFTVPVYNTIGNHEVFGLYEKSGISPNHQEYGKIMYKKRLEKNETYYSFDHKGWHFIILDAIGFTEDRHYFGNVDSLQLEWLKKDLENVSKETPIAVSTHIPFISVAEQMRNGGTAAFTAGSIVANSHKVLRLLDDYNLRLVLQGHLHIVEEIIFHNTHFITGGAVSGKWWKGARAGFPEGFVVVDVKKNNEFTWTYETYGWQAVEE